MTRYILPLAIIVVAFGACARPPEESNFNSEPTLPPRPLLELVIPFGGGAPGAAYAVWLYYDPAGAPAETFPLAADGAFHVKLLAPEGLSAATVTGFPLYLGTERLGRFELKTFETSSPQKDGDASVQWVFTAPPGGEKIWTAYAAVYSCCAASETTSYIPLIQPYPAAFVWRLEPDRARR